MPVKPGRKIVEMLVFTPAMPQIKKKRKKDAFDEVCEFLDKMDAKTDAKIRKDEEDWG